jgi:hypothetical protein
LSAESRVHRLEAVILIDCFPRAVRTSPSIIPAVYRRLPFVTFAAEPPHLLARSGTDIFWSQGRILRWVPLLGEFWVHSLQAIILVEPLPRAIGTPRAVMTIVDRGLPFMPPTADPPDLSAAPDRDIGGRQITISRRVPLSGKFGIA